MPEPLLHRETFSVHTYEVDAFRELAIPALTGFLVEAAGRHAAALGVGIEALQAKGVTWVLARLRLEVPAAVGVGDLLEVETWPCGLDRLAALRSYRVRRGGAEVARAVTQWLVMSVAARRPVRPDAVLDPSFPRERIPTALELAAEKLPELARWDAQKRFHIRYADIDLNAHVNNGSYLAWAMEGIPRDVWRSSRLAAIEVQYLAECQEGSAILSRVAATGDGEFAHAIVREEDGKELARAVTRWVKRGASGTP